MNNTKIDFKNVLAGIGIGAVFLFLVAMGANKDGAITASLLGSDISESEIITKDAIVDGNVVSSPEEVKVCGYIKEFGSGIDFPFGWGIATGPNGKVFITNAGNQTQNKVLDVNNGKIVDFGSSSGTSNGVTVDKNGYVYMTYVNDKDKSVAMYDANGVLQKSWTHYNGNTSFFQASAIAFDSASGKFFISQVGNNAPSSIGLFSLTSTNKKDAGFVKWVGKTGTGPGKYVQVGGLAPDSSGNLWVTDINQNKVIKYLTNGSFIEIIGSGDNKLNKPIGIAIAPNGDVYVVDSANNRVMIYDSNGNYKSQFGAKTSGGNGLSNPIGIAFDENGDVYIMNQGSKTVKKFTKPCATVTVVKNTSPANTKLFDFWITNVYKGFKLSHNQKYTFEMMESNEGVYETVVPGYNSSVNCSITQGSLGGGQSVNYAKAPEVGANMYLYDGQKVNCTFKNVCVATGGAACAVSDDSGLRE